MSDIIYITPMIIIIGIIGVMIYFWFQEERNNTSIKKAKEFEKLKIQVQLLQDTLDHYGIRMSNKIPDENPYYKRWYK